MTVRQKTAAELNQGLFDSPAGFNASGVKDCSVCNGHGFYYVQIGADVAVTPCQCSRTTNNAMESLGIPDNFKGCSFNNYNPQNESQAAAHVACRKFCQNFPSGQWLLLQGPRGTGKTHLAVSILKQLCTGLFYPVDALLEAIKDEMRGPKIVETLVEETELLVLDDIGFEHATEWAASKLNSLINKRYNQNLATVITTNLSEKTGSLEGHVTSRIASRLKEKCVVLTVDGDDYRGKK